MKKAFNTEEENGTEYTITDLKFLITDARI